MGLLPKAVSSAISIGVLTHKALERLQSDGVEVALADAKAEFETQVAAYPNSDFEGVWDMTEHLVRGYRQRYAQDDMVELQAEFEFKVILTDEEGHKWPYTGRVDNIVMLKNRPEALFVKETKTTGFAPSQFLQRFTMSSQITGYLLGAQTVKLPAPVKGVIVDAIFRPRRRKDGTIGMLSDNSFVREAFFRSPTEIVDFIKDTTRTFKEIDSLRKEPTEAESTDATKWSKNTEYCYHWGRPCEYLDLCKYGHSEELVESLFTKEVEETKE